MPKRTCRFELRLTKDEFSELSKKAKKSGLSNAAFVRRAVHGTEIKEAPPADVPQLLNHMRRVGYNLDQILKRANSTGVLDVPQLRKDIADTRAAVKAVQDAYTMKNS